MRHINNIYSIYLVMIITWMSIQSDTCLEGWRKEHAKILAKF